MKALLCFVLLLAACDRMPGKPREADRYRRPSRVSDFATLYSENCFACHGDEQQPGGAVSLSDPVYLAFADDDAIRRATAQGVPDTTMPGFARSAGGTLTDDQVEALVRGMRERWAGATVIGGTPPYAAAPGDAARGAQVYAARCASCHGPDGNGGDKGGAVTDGSYLALVSNQGLRTAVVVGHPRLGMPDWRGPKPEQGGPAQPMSAAETADVVAWLISKRQTFPGQPYARAE